MTASLNRSLVFEFADQVVERMAAHDPVFATSAGITGFDHLLADFSSARWREERERIEEELATLEMIELTDDRDRIAREVIVERLGSMLELLSSDEQRRTFSVLWSPLSEMRQTFEMMTINTPEHLDVVRARLIQVRPALESWRSGLRDAVALGQLPARRHVEGVAEQARTYAEGTYLEFATRAARVASVDLEGSDLASAARDADAACGEMADWLLSDVAPFADAVEACGPERYHRWSNYYCGATLDLDELYTWGYQDLRRIHARMWELAETLTPGAGSLVEVARHLDNDPTRLVDGTDELLTRLKDFTNQAVTDLDGVHFDIDSRIRFCDVRLAPAGGAAAPYYMAPSEDLSRPGTTWFPTLGETTFPWWRQVSTWYHEGVPGHHLQIATALLSADQQTRFQRLLGMTSGYCEGWALYAERLMDELGYFSDPAAELDFLANQALRAARVVVDLGLHLELDAPADLGVLGDLGDCSGRRWTPEMAVSLLEEWAIQHHAMSVSEVDRYLGNPAQAISYKVGERVWLKARADAQERLGGGFSLKAFHAYALTLGPLGLDTFASEMASWDGGA